MTLDSYRILRTTIGWVGLLWSAVGLKRCTLPCINSTQALYKLELDKPCDEAPEYDEQFLDISRYLTDYLLGLKPIHKPLLDIKGTDFQTLVWSVTSFIPYGTTKTYSWVAYQIGKADSYRAVGQALKANPLPIFIPCHRVISSGNGLGGYSGIEGVDTKEQLLKLEGYL